MDWVYRNTGMNRLGAMFSSATSFLSREEIEASLRESGEEVPSLITEMSAEERLEAEKIANATESLSQEELVRASGVSEKLVEFVRAICRYPQTFVDFPLDPGDVERFRMTCAQEQHAVHILREVPELQEIRFKLCPRHISEPQFWLVYFAICRGKIDAIFGDKPPLPAVDSNADEWAIESDSDVDSDGDGDGNESTPSGLRHSGGGGPAARSGGGAASSAGIASGRRGHATGSVYSSSTSSSSTSSSSSSSSSSSGRVHSAASSTSLPPPDQYFCEQDSTSRAVSAFAAHFRREKPRLTTAEQDTLPASYPSTWTQSDGYADRQRLRNYVNRHTVLPVYALDASPAESAAMLEAAAAVSSSSSSSSSSASATLHTASSSLVPHLSETSSTTTTATATAPSSAISSASTTLSMTSSCSGKTAAGAPARATCSLDEIANSQPSGSELLAALADEHSLDAWLALFPRLRELTAQSSKAVDPSLLFSASTPTRPTSKGPTTQPSSSSSASSASASSSFTSSASSSQASSQASSSSPTESTLVEPFPSAGDEASSSASEPAMTSAAASSSVPSATPSVGSTRARQVRNLIRKEGIPSVFRKHVWLLVSGTSKFLEKESRVCNISGMPALDDPHGMPSPSSPRRHQPAQDPHHRRSSLEATRPVSSGSPRSNSGSPASARRARSLTTGTDISAADPSLSSAVSASASTSLSSLHASDSSASVVASSSATEKANASNQFSCAYDDPTDSKMRSHDGLLANMYYAKVLRRVFGDRVPKRCPAIPTFGGSILSHNQYFLTAEGIEAAKRILVVLGVEHPDLEHVATLPALVFTLLHYMSEAEAYSVCHVLTVSSYENVYLHEGGRLRRFFCTNEVVEQLYVAAFADLVRKNTPQLYERMVHINIRPEEFATDWFRTLFVTCLPFHFCLRIFDSFVTEGSRTLYRVGLALLTLLQTELLLCTSDDEFRNTLFKSGRSLTPAQASSLMKLSFTITIHQTDLQKFNTENKERFSAKTAPQDYVFIRPKVRTPSSILTPLQLEVVWSWLPSRCHVKTMQLLFSSKIDGYSLSMFYQKVKKQEPTLLFVKTKHGRCFGAYISKAWRPQPSYYGSGESWVFSSYPHLNKYEWQPGNKDYFMLAKPDHIIVGGGAIWLDAELWKGRTAKSTTFESPPLDGRSSDISHFQCVMVEVYGFVSGY